MFADENFEFDENSWKFSRWVENTVEKGEIARSEQFILFPQCFQKICTADTKKKKKNQGLFGEGLNVTSLNFFIYTYYFCLTLYHNYNSEFERSWQKMF